MSSILKALKKLDDDLPRKRRTVVWSSGAKSRKAIRRWDIGAGRSTAVLWGLLGTALVVVAGGLYLYLKPTDDSRMETTAAVTRPISQPDQPAKVTQPPAGLPEKQPQDAVAPKTKPRTVPAAPVAKPAPPAARKQRQTPPERKSPERAKKATQPRESAKPSLPILTSDLQLQAISWAPAPGDRLAVINGSIVREGASLEGYVIVKIEKEEVAVRKGAEQWKLVFDLK